MVGGVMIRAQIVYFDVQGKVAVLPLPLHGATIGRGAGCVIAAPDPQLSQLHATVKLIRDIWHVEDHSSTNGTTVNGSRITSPTRLRHMDVIVCGSLHMRFMLVSGSEQATLPDVGLQQSLSLSNDFSALREEITGLKKERDDLLEQLELEGRELAGVKSENRQLRQAQDDLRSKLAATQRQLEQEQAKEQALRASSLASVRVATAEQEEQRKLQARADALQAAREVQSLALQRAEQDIRRLKGQVSTLEEELGVLTQGKEEAVRLVNHRQSEIEDLRGQLSDWKSYKSRAEAEQRVSAERLKQLLENIESLETALRSSKKDLNHLRERYDEKNEQHRGLRAEFDQLKHEFDRNADQAKRQIERLAKDKEAMQTQLQELRQGKTNQGGQNEAADNPLLQLSGELRQAHQVLTRENSALRKALTQALRWHITLSQANPADPAILKLRDAIEQACAQADQISKALQQLAASSALVLTHQSP